MRRLATSLARAVLFLGPAAIAGPPPVEAQVYRLAELNTEQIRALDRERTVILLPGGILEEHGPFLPSYADGYANERITADLAAAIARRPGWKAVVFPAIPLGSGGANEIGARHSFPGTYAVRPATLRAVFMDLATALGDQGFKWVFVIHGHGSPSHNRALDEAGEFFRDTYGGRMVHLLGCILGTGGEAAILAASLTKQALAEDGFTVHAGIAEHSELMALRPDLVPAAVKTAPSVTGRDVPDLVRLASEPAWPGYFGAPRYASAEIGRKLVEAEGRQRVALALRLLDGLDEREVPRYTAMIAQVPGIDGIMQRSGQRDAAVEEREGQWLAARGAQDPRQELQALDETWNTAWREKNAATVDALAAPEYSYVGPNGRVMDRAAILQVIRSPTYRLDQGTLTVEAVQLLGSDAAVLTDHSQAKGSYEGQAFDEDHRCVRVCARRGGQWRIVHEQCSPIK